MKRRIEKGIIIVVGILIIGMNVFIGMKSSVNRKIADDTINDIGITETTAEEYYENNSTIINTCDVKKSKTVQSENQAIKALCDRGFDQEAVTYDYSIDGELLNDDKEATNCKEKHPIYHTYYTTPNEDVWMIDVVNGSITANPISYNLESDRGANLIFSETKEITGYSSKANTFYKTIPDESELIVKIVDKINSDTLDKLTNDKIAGM